VVGRPDGGSTAGVNPLFGSWSATRWQYTSREEPARVVDLVADRGGVVTLSLTDETYVLTHDVADRGHHSVGGTVAINGEMLQLRAQGGDGMEAVRFRVAGDTLALTAADSGWDFDGDGQEEAASMVAVFVRL
jgi:hypothetical protein